MCTSQQPSDGADSQPLEVIDSIVLTPKWIGVFRIYVEVIANPKAGQGARNIAWRELERMAEAADKWNEYVEQINNVDTMGADL